MASYHIFCPELCCVPLLIYQFCCLWENERTIQFRLMAADGFRVYLQVLSIGYKDGIILCATLLEFVLFVVFEFQELNVPLLFFRFFCKLNWVLCSLHSKIFAASYLKIFAPSYLLLFQHDFLSYILVYARTIYFHYKFFALCAGKVVLNYGNMSHIWSNLQGAPWWRVCLLYSILSKESSFCISSIFCFFFSFFFLSSPNLCFSTVTLTLAVELFRDCLEPQVGLQ